MRTQYAELVIFSVERSNWSRVDNQTNTETIESWLNMTKIPYQRVNGVYKTSSETSFVVPGRFQRDIEAIARDFEQESILLRHNDLSCELQYLSDGRLESIGTWTEVGRHEVKNFDSYTEDIENNRYFVVKGA